jgi:hypothetical protein
VLEVKESQTDGAGLGYFAARDFAKGECMGLYVWKIVSPIMKNQQYTQLDQEMLIFVLTQWAEASKTLRLAEHITVWDSMGKEILFDYGYDP